MTKLIPNHSKISPTAKMVAYWRQFSDIPFAYEVAKLVHAEEVFKLFLKDTNVSIESMSWFAPMIEARYKSMIHMIRRQNIKQILELASGVSLRGLAMTSDPEVVYVETDLPEMSAEKKAIVQKIRKQKSIPERKNLFFREVNILNLNELEEATLPFFDNNPIAIIHEGLFQYLSLEEKKLAATHIHSLLKKFGGVWITPDLNTKEEIDEQWNCSNSIKQLTESVKNFTQRDFRENAFENKAHIQDFFEKMGFEIQEFPQIDNSFDLTSIKELHVPQDTLRTHTAYLKIWILRALPIS